MTIYDFYILMRRPSKTVTQAHIALRAGVSQSAVSAILAGSNSRNVSSDTRARVLALAEELGYLTRKSSSPGDSDTHRRNVLIVESHTSSSRRTNEEWVEIAYQGFTGKILTSSGEYLQQQGVGFSVFQFKDSEKNSLTQWLADSDIAGVLWHAEDSDSALLHWVASRFPLVLLNRDWQSSIPFDSVGISQEQNILLAAEHLWAQGHRRIATFGHQPGNPLCRRRMAAYTQFVEERGLRNYREFQEISDAPHVPAIEKVTAILETWSRLGSEAPTALITGDVFALPLLQKAQTLGISIPADLSVIGFDNTAPCSFVTPALTSIEEPLEEMCRIAVDLLLRRIADHSAASVAVQICPHLVIRHSVHDLLQRNPAPTIA